MGCSGCSTGRGCSTTSGLPGGCKNNGSCGTGGCNKLNVFNWLADISLPNGQQPCEFVEVRFKNSRKEFFKNVNNLPLMAGEVIAVEASPGHDIGVVSLTGELVKTQMKRKNISPTSEEIKKIYRKAKPADVEKWIEAQELESATMYRARTVAVRLKLSMKISDVEYQGDKTKAIFYYTADERVDFRELIKLLAEEFKVRIEMKQIGARQEASRLGGIGSCGRELCCSTWLTDFRSVSTSAARYQQLSLNPLKLAGQCGKLKCCLNYELDSYLDAIKDFPEINNVKLESEKGKAFHQKTDIFKRVMYFSYFEEPDNFIPLPVDRVKEVMEMNKNSLKPTDLLIQVKQKVEIKKPDYENVVGQDSLTRFDQKTSKNKRKKKKGPKPNQPIGENTLVANPQNKTSRPVQPARDKMKGPNQQAAQKNQEQQPQGSDRPVRPPQRKHQGNRNRNKKDPNKPDQNKPQTSQGDANG